MRADMSKVIVERPRKGGWKARPGRGAAPDDLPSKQGMRRLYRNTTKWLNENLAPLKRFIGSRVGQHWDKVFSEICQNLRVDSAVQKHVRDHLGGIVALTPALRDGRILVQARRGGAFEELSKTRFRYYVHPKSGVLTRNTKYDSGASRFSATRQRAAQEISLRMRRIAPGEQLHRLKGIWYHVTIATMPEPQKITKVMQGGRVKTLLRQPKFRDVIRDAGLSSLSAQDLYGWRYYYATAKRQLSKRELTKYELENE
jgi:hypothetical protein